MRLIVRFCKLGRLKYISHLDLQRFMQRALRRTDLPVSYSKGFNPHAQLAFASALATGWTSEYELFDVKLEREVAIGEALARVQSALPPEMPAVEARFVEDSHPALMAMLTYADYRVTPCRDLDALSGAIDGYMSETSVMATRVTKSGERQADIRPMTASLLREGDALSMRLMLTEVSTLKPDLMMRVLSQRAGVDAPDCAIHRLCLLTKDGTPLFQA